MIEPAILAEVWRGGRVESRHRGHAVVVNETGEIIASWGDPSALIYPRSSCKVIQSLPLIESGAAEAFGVGPEHLALACSSHVGSARHTGLVRDWLSSLGMEEDDLRCGAQKPEDREERQRLRADGSMPTQIHNYCSGKHTGFLTLAKHLGAGPEYIDPDHPVQRAVRAAFEEMTDETSPGYGIDGCSAPNFACTLTGLARAMARLTAPERLGATRGAAARRMVDAMRAHPILIDGRGKASTDLAAQSGGKAILKTGAEGVFTAILPEARAGIALKIEDGATRASEAAIAGLLIRLGIYQDGDPTIKRWASAEIRNWRGILTGHVMAAPALLDG